MGLEQNLEYLIRILMKICSQAEKVKVTSGD